MGDIASTDLAVARLHLDVATHSPILRIDVLNGAEWSYPCRDTGRMPPTRG